MTTRRKFIQAAGTFIITLPALDDTTLSTGKKKGVRLYAHLWAYASRFPPNWDCTPILDEVFSDLKYAGFLGVELMESVLKHDGSVQRLLELSQKYSLPVAGSSYYGDMWKREEKQGILDDVESVVEKLHAAGGTMLGVTTGNARRQKTEDELDAQADVLSEIMRICKKNNVVPNLHNHTFEVENDMHDFKGTIKRVPDLKLGPDLNWLIRGGIDPVWFINTYGHNMVFMHLRDQDANGKWTEALGEGTTDFAAIAKALKKINYRGSAAVELAFEGQPVRPVRQSWKSSRDYVHKIFGW